MKLEQFLRTYKDQISFSGEWLIMHWKYVQSEITRKAFKEFLILIGFSKSDANEYLLVLGSPAKLRKIMKAASDNIKLMDDMIFCYRYESFDINAPVVKRKHSAGRQVFVSWLKDKFRMTAGEAGILYRYVGSLKIVRSNQAIVGVLLGSKNSE